MTNAKYRQADRQEHRQEMPNGKNEKTTFESNHCARQFEKIVVRGFKKKIKKKLKCCDLSQSCLFPLREPLESQIRSIPDVNMI